MLHQGTTSPYGAPCSHHASISKATVSPHTSRRAFVAQRTATAESPILLPTALLHVHDYGGKRLLVRALIDQGSKTSFISDSLVQKLKLMRTPACVQIQEVGEALSALSKGRTAIKLSPRIDPRFSRTINTLIR